MDPLILKHKYGFDKVIETNDNFTMRTVELNPGQVCEISKFSFLAVYSVYGTCFLNQNLPHAKIERTLMPGRHFTSDAAHTTCVIKSSDTSIASLIVVTDTQEKRDVIFDVFSTH